MPLGLCFLNAGSEFPATSEGSPLDSEVAGVSRRRRKATAREHVPHPREIFSSMFDFVRHREPLADISQSFHHLLAVPSESESLAPS